MAQTKEIVWGIACPCYKCEERCVDCHGYCEKYKTFQKENEELKAKKRREDRKAYYAKYLNNYN